MWSRDKRTRPSKVKKICCVFSFHRAEIFRIVWGNKFPPTHDKSLERWLSFPRVSCYDISSRRVQRIRIIFSVEFCGVFTTFWNNFVWNNKTDPHTPRIPNVLSSQTFRSCFLFLQFDPFENFLDILANKNRKPGTGRVKMQTEFTFYDCNFRANSIKSSFTQLAVSSTT